MKTPKRIIPCPQCGAPCELGISVIESWDERYEVPALFCTRSGEEVVGNVKHICARYTRKNREARLRNKISVLQQRMQFAETCIPDLIEELEKYQRESGRAVTSKAVAAIVAGKLFLAPCWRAKKNHDMEGS